jgi:hypothetical protein
MKYFYSIIFVIIIYSVSSSIPCHIQELAFGKTDDIVFSANNMPYNHTFNHWVEKYFKWFLSLPNIEGSASLSHPRDVYSPEKCSWNQNKSSPVWMLADGPDQNDLSVKQNRDCKVPVGKALLVQIVGSNCSFNEGYTTDQELLVCANWILDKAQFSASVDGKEVMNTNKDPNDRDKFFVKPFITSITYAKNNLYGAAEGTYRGMEAGYFLFVKPLALGDHVIEYQVSAINALDRSGTDKRISNMQYNIAVENDTNVIR